MYVLCTCARHCAMRALHRSKYYNRYFTDEKNENHMLNKSLRSH